MQLFLFVCNVILGNLVFLVKSQQFDWWLTVSITDVEFGINCFLSGCGKPNLQLATKSIIESGNEKTISWPIDPDKFQLKSQKRDPWLIFVPKSFPESQNVSLYSAIAGVDLTYNFPRICDKTEFAYAAPEKGKSETILLQGNCYNVSVKTSWSCDNFICSVKTENESSGKGLFSCCGEKELQLKQAEPAVARSAVVAGIDLSNSVPLWLVIALSVVILALVALCVFLIAMHINQKRRFNKSGSNSSSPSSLNCMRAAGNKLSVNTNNSHVRRSLSEESRYDVPWDQKFRPLPDYVRELQNAVNGPSKKGVINGAPSLVDSGAESV